MNDGLVMVTFDWDWDGDGVSFALAASCLDNDVTPATFATPTAHLTHDGKAKEAKDD